MGDRKRIAVVTVHGTGDTAVAPVGDKWFQSGSRFASALTERLRGAGIEAEITPFLWDGANSSRAREIAGEKLAKMLRRLAKSYDALHLIGHSHGGNVVNEALIGLRWGLRRRLGIGSVVAVGTPFLETRTVPTFGFVWVAQLLCAASGLGALAYMVQQSMSEATAESPAMLAVYTLLVLTGAFLLTLSVLRYRKQLVASRAAPKRKHDGEIAAIWHPNDEAISFLQSVHTLRVEPFARGALFRASESGVTAQAARFAVLVIMLSAAAFIYFSIVGPSDYIGTAGTDLAIALLAAGPVAFFLVYLVFRLVYGVLPEIGRPSINAGVSNALKGFAFGRDSERSITSASPESYSYATRNILLDGACADRMKAEAGASVSRLIEKYRWSIFGVGANLDSVLTDLARDTMTWDSLIHTTYFDQSEVVDLIAAEIIRADD